LMKRRDADGIGKRSAFPSGKCSERHRHIRWAEGEGTHISRGEAGVSVLRKTIQLAKCADGQHAAGLALVVRRADGGVSFDVLDAVQSCSNGTPQIMQRGI